MLQVQQWSGCIKRSGSCMDINVRSIAKLIKIAMGELTGVSSILANVEDTIHLTCDSSSSNNRMVKIDMSPCKTRLVGVSLYGSTRAFSIACLNHNRMELNCKMMSAQVDCENTDQVEKIERYFDEKFNTIVKKSRSPRCKNTTLNTDDLNLRVSTD